MPDSPRSQKQKGSLNFQLAKRVFSYSFAYPVLLVTVYVILFISSMLSTYNPGLGEQLVYILSQDDKVNQLTSFIIERFTIELTLGGLECAQTYFQFLLSRKVERKMQEEFYGSLLEKDIDYYENKKIGELTSKLTGDLMSLRSLAISDMSGMFSKISSMVGSLVFMMSISPRLVLTFMVLLAPRIGLIWYFKDYFRESNKIITKLRTDATSIVTETFFNIKTVKSFSSEEKEFKKYTKKLDEYGEKNYDNTKKELFYRMGMNILKTLLFTLVALQGAYIVIDGEITAFQLSRFISYSRSLSMSFLMIEGNIKRILTSLGNAERVFKELDARPKIDPKAGKVVLEKGISGDITFSNVSFSYPSKKEVKVLKNINLEIKKGEHVAIVGESGGGKTTFTSLIQRLYDPVEGEIRIGNRSLKEFDLKWLHSKMGVISQDPALFSGTIEENVVYGVDMYSDEDVDKAITKAYMKKFVEDKELFPEGLQTHVGERGSKLSGGQRQRVAIARALIKKPDLLVFDEATSALDSESEHQIMKGLDQLLKNKEQTVIVIAHRLSTIMHCDKIVVCQNGEIVEAGNHQELLEKSGIYRNLVERQFFSLKEKIK